MAGRLLDTFSEKQEKRPRRFNFTRRIIERLLEISQNSPGQMRNVFSKILLILLVGEVSFGLSVAQAGPLDFFRRIRDSIAHPRHHQRTVTKTQSKGDNGTTVKRNDVRPPELKEPETTEAPELHMGDLFASVARAHWTRVPASPLFPVLLVPVA